MELSDLEQAISLQQELAREDMLLQVRDNIIRERSLVDVVGYWRGYDDKGQGLVEYRGRTYVCTVLARSCKQYGAKVNLRRTRNGNFVNWP